MSNHALPRLFHISVIFPGKSKETVLITGCHGFVGQHVVRLFVEESSCELVLTAREEKSLFAGMEKEPRIRAYHPMDVTQRTSVRDVIGMAKPDVIVNCAGFVKVDEAETQREAAWRANVTALEHLTEIARKIDARIVHISSDLVFDGTRAPYAELDTPHPINYYGRTKLASENVLRTCGIEYTIFRTSSVYGAADHANTNYALSVIASIESGEPVMAATDLINAPTLVDDLALAIVRATERRRLGLYHAGGPEMITRFEFAQRIVEMFGLNASMIVPTTVSELRSSGRWRAERPARNGLVSLKAQTDLGIRLSNVDDGLRVMERGMEELLGESELYLYE
ncbi:MAG TPA: SDR family oxidoreductase [Candidatus Kapabacteria bacterium]|nr:SDR family oxidoreductase [Candidatus Kapabacteria bacterium]